MDKVTNSLSTGVNEVEIGWVKGRGSRVNNVSLYGSIVR